jgi:hypothetical protein
MSDRQGVSLSGLLKLGLAIVVVATIVGLAITELLLPATRGSKHALVTTTTAAPCAREQALVFFDQRLLAQSGPGTLSKPSFAAQAFGEAQAKLAACVAALSQQANTPTTR